MIMSFWVKTYSELSSISSSPLFSSIVTLYALILLYLPTHFTRIALSPVLIITATLLLSLLRLGATQSDLSLRSNPKPTDHQTTEDHQWVLCTYRSDSEDSDYDYDSDPETGHETRPSFEDSFVQWNLGAPLEVIYEEEDEELFEEEGEKRALRFNPESDSENSSDGDFAENVRVDWEEEEEEEEEEEDEREEGLIEIALDFKSHCNDEKIRGFGFGIGFHVDEDNLIEIDISPPTLPRFT